MENLEYFEIPDPRTGIKINVVSLETHKAMMEILDTKSAELTNFLVKMEKNKSCTDQQLFRHDRELSDVLTLIKAEEKARLLAESKLTNMEVSYQLMESQLLKANQNANDMSSALERSNTDTSSVSMHTASFVESLESRDKLIKELKKRISSLEVLLSAQQTTKQQALQELEDSNRTKRQLFYKDQHFQQEKVLMQREITHLQAELKTRSEEMIMLHKSNSSKILALQSEITQLEEKESSASTEAQELSHVVDDKSLRIDQLLASLNETRESELKMEESYRHELSTQEKLCEVYKCASKDQEQRCTELENDMLQLRALLQEASDHYGALERAKENSEAEAQTTIDAQNSLIQELREECNIINKTLKGFITDDDEGYAGSTSAVAVRELMKKGLTLTQLYSEYMVTVEKLFSAEEDNKRLNKYVGDIVQEKEDQQPILNKQKEEYQDALENINVLDRQLQKLTSELQQEKSATTDAVEKTIKLGGTNSQLEQQVQDLSKQVTYLLMQVESAKHGTPTASLVSENCAYLTRAEDVIDAKLVTFSDVAEMQEQNIKLLASIRDLTTQLESVEESVFRTKTNELQMELEMARSELTELRESSIKLQSTVFKLNTQKEMSYSRAEQNHSQTSILDKSRDEPDVSKLLEERNSELVNLNKTYAQYREKSEQGERVTKERIQHLESNSEQMRMDKLKLLTQAEYNEERIKALTNNCDTLQRQIKALEAKCNTLQGTVGRQEGIGHTIEERNIQLNHQVASLQLAVDQLKEEKLLLMGNAEKLLAEREHLLSGKESQDVILSNLESIKICLDKNSSEVKNHLELQVYELSRQCAQLQAKVESKSEMVDSRVSIATLQESLDKSQLEVSKLKQELKDRNTSIDQALGPGLTTSWKSKLDYEPASTTGEMTRELEVELAEYKARVSSMLAKQKELEQNIDQFKKLCDFQELQIKEATEANKSAEEQVNSLQLETGNLQEQICILNQNLSSIKQTEEANRTTMIQQLSTLTETLNEKETSLAEAIKCREEAEASQKSALNDLKETTGWASISQDKYEKEVILHSADLQALASTKEKLQLFINENSELKNDKDKTTKEIAELVRVTTEKEQELKKRTETQQTRLDELEAQNRSLLNQLTDLSVKVSSMQTTVNPDPASSSDLAIESSSQLQEIISFLRKEKEISICKVEASHMETQRLRTQKSSLENQVESLEKSLHEEQKRNQDLVETSNTCGSMIRKAETIQALSDSNRLLRDEKEVMQSALDQSNAKINSLQEQINPLQDKIRDLNVRTETFTADKKSIEDEKCMYKKRCQDLVQKLNKTNPEDLARLRQEAKTLKQELESKTTESNQLRTHANNLQKTQQTVMSNKNQLQIQLNAMREELKSALDDAKKFSQEKIRIQQQTLHHMEKTRNLELSQNQTISSHRTELQDFSTLVSEMAKKEEGNRRLGDALKKDNDFKEKRVAELLSKVEALERQAVQLRKIALKYKEKAGSNEAGEEELTGAAQDKIRDLEQKVASLDQQLKQSKSLIDKNKVTSAPIEASIPIQQKSAVVTQPPISAAIAPKEDTKDNKDTIASKAQPSQESLTPPKTTVVPKDVESTKTSQGNPDVDSATTSTQKSPEASDSSTACQVSQGPIIQVTQTPDSVSVEESVTEQTPEPMQIVTSSKRKCDVVTANDVETKRPRLEDAPIEVVPVIQVHSPDSVEDVLQSTNEPVTPCENSKVDTEQEDTLMLPDESEGGDTPQTGASPSASPVENVSSSGDAQNSVVTVDTSTDECS